MLRVVLTLASLGLTIYALIDCIQTPDDRVRHIPKLVWALLVLLVPWVGPITWLLAGRRRDTPPRRGRIGPKGPEDDPDFLRRL